MKLEEIYTEGQKPISYEVFPPKDENGSTDGEDSLISHLKILKQFNPALISVTYGAGGSSRDRSAKTVSRIKKDVSQSLMPHFTCICSTKPFIESYIKAIENEGIENILALRGDPPANADDVKSDFKYADELIAFIRERTSLSIAAAGYPEGHVDSKSLKEDTNYLKGKIDAGACAIFTQLFFDNRFFFEFLERISKAGINVPVIPGILPAKSYAQMQKMTEKCGASIPKKAQDLFLKYKDSKEDSIKAGIEMAINQSKELLSGGAAGLHFYTLNHSSMVSEILKNL